MSDVASIPHPSLALLGALVGLAGLAGGSALARRGGPAALVTPAVAAVAWLLGPSLGGAATSWDRPVVVVVVVVALTVAFGATGGVVAAGPLGPTGATGCLAVVAGATVLAVPDTEGPVLIAAALAVVTAGPALVEGWDLPEGAAALTAGIVVLVGLSGATDGVVAALGAGGCTAVLLGAAPLTRHRRPGDLGPIVAPWAAVAVVGLGAVIVARLGAVRATSLRALLVTVAATAAVAVGLEVAARLTSGPARRSR